MLRTVLVSAPLLVLVSGCSTSPKTRTVAEIVVARAKRPAPPKGPPASAASSQGNLDHEQRMQQVRELVSRIKVGMKRSEVEAIFRHKDGGIQHTSLTLYYEDPEVMVEVPFESTGGDWSRENRVNGSVRVYRSLPHLD